MLTGNQIRRMFLDFFVQKGHREVHSSSLVPANDPTLLFTNAGMNQFKDVFLGLEKRDYSRATTSQKCVRAGGKHNDLENVGFTNRHHTFFEMLGNFSFGDYFKKDAIAYAWELVTSPEWFGIPKDRMYITIFNGEGGMQRDAEAYDHWIAQGVPADRIFEMGMKDNFWSMGDTGPCGPCSELHYDMGPIASDGHRPECAAGECRFPCECGRYVEIWNLVFMQFDRDAAGTLNPLPKPSIDTGAGLERVTSVLQGVISNYETDLFIPLIERAAELTGVSAAKESAREAKATSAASLRVIADHSRAATFLISDGVMPANEGRGYVLRKIIRRAIRHGRLLGQNKPFLHEMVFAVRDEMQEAYPELKDSADRVSKVIQTEETRFAHTLDIGLKRLEDDLAPLVSAKQQNEAARATYSGEKAFKLYDTFGLPLDFMVDAARDQGILFDHAGFERAMEEQRATARASWKGGAKQTASPVFSRLPQTVFEGYRQTQSSDCEVLAIIVDGQGVQELKPGEKGEIVLDHTPFYAESGGQVGDKGWFYSSDQTTLVGEVSGVHSPIQGVRAHVTTARQTIVVGDKINAVVDSDLREQTMRHHTGTHLLHAALRSTLGTHVKQAGSLVSPGYLRFDFSHFAGVSDEDLQDIEDIVNREVLRNEKVEVIEDVPIDVAVNEYKAMALFGEKYGEKVRVIRIGDFSTELCGGTHTKATGEIGLIKVLKEGSVSSGVRRLEAVAGEASLRHFRKDHQLENVVSTLVGRSDQSPAEALRAEIERRDEEVKRLRRELEQVRMKSAASAVSSADNSVKLVKGVKVLAHRADNLERPQLRTLVDNFRTKIGSGVVVIGSVADGKVALIVGVTKDLTDRVPAGKVIAQVAKAVGGSGGGRPDMAEAGGKNPEALDEALSGAYGVVDSLIG
ncbi:MAG TPA: alanine--tRNA ligase [Clostridia bacterium]|nr:alanine--tRNA ligase [Clostridia bacterium]